MTGLVQPVVSWWPSGGSFQAIAPMWTAPNLGIVDYGEGPMVRHPETRKYRRTRLFVMTLGFSRKALRLLVWASSVRIWAELHEQASRRLNGATATIVLDNLREGCSSPTSTTRSSIRCTATCSLTTARPRCSVAPGIPDRKGKVESGIGHTQRTPLQGLRVETLEEVQRYLDEWDTRWADTRIHGTTKRQVAAMFADEQPHLLALPVEPFGFASRPT